MNQHTPPPWTKRVGYDTNGEPLEYVIEAGREIIASVYSLMTEHDDGEANANLITASPDLLAAVKHLQVCDFPEEIDFRCEGCNAARAAVAKAEGKTSA